MTIATLALMLRFSWQLTLAVLVMIPLVALPARRAGRATYQARARTQSLRGRRTGYLQEILGISGIMLVKAFGRESAERQRFAAMNAELCGLEVRQNLIRQWFGMLMSTLLTAGPALMILFGGWLVVNGRASIGTVFVCVPGSPGPGGGTGGRAHRRWHVAAGQRRHPHHSLRHQGPRPRSAPGDAGNALLQVIGFDYEAAAVRHLDHAAHGRLPDTPAGHLTVTTTFDPSQAAPGPYGPLHTLRFETIAPPVRADGGWTRPNAAEYRARCLDLLRATTTGLDAARVLSSFSDSPRDLERRFRTVRNGSVRQGRISRAQTFATRPHSECSSARTPLRALYLAGGGVHPGVPGSLGGGYNAAAAVCADLPDLVRWWPEPAFVQQALDARLMPERAAAGAARGARRPAPGTTEQQFHGGDVARQLIVATEVPGHWSRLTLFGSGKRVVPTKSANPR